MVHSRMPEADRSAPINHPLATTQPKSPKARTPSNNDSVSLKKHRMVGWYDPPQLLRTAGQVVTSTIFGRHADYRLIEALYDDPDDLPDDDPTHFIIDYSQHKDFWLDYVADLGEGWNSTYAVAYHSSRPKLDLNWEKHLYVTVRGHVILFGGDEVYPTASRSAYKERTFHPYECAYNGDNARPDMFAIPGNHDWYDSLVAFTRYFIDKDEIAGFPTPQLRSYFAMKLPHGWWLLALDTQLTSYIDGPQVKYFQLVAKQIPDGDSIILCNSEPTWFYEAEYQRYDLNVNDRNLDFVEKEILKGKSVQVFLAGDLHHYRRHEAQDGTQKIIAGGGGAFLHPTHGWKVNDLVETLPPTQADAARTFHHKASWPSPSVSRLLSFRNGLFPLVNWKFGLVPASLYLLTAWSVMAKVGDTSDVTEAASRVLEKLLLTPFPIFWAAVLFLGFFLFTDTYVKWYRWTAGTLHAVSHIAATFFIGWGASYFAMTTLGLQYQTPKQLLLTGSLIVLGGWIVGSLLLGIYLLISLNVFGRHMNEAFSSLRIEDWKHFLRLHVDEGGRLTIFPIGIQRVPRRWKESTKDIGPRFESDDPRATQPELIEAPIILTHRNKEC